MTIFDAIRTKNNFLNLLIGLIPLSFIIGNSAINLNIFLIILFAFSFHRLEIFKIKYFYIDKIIFLVFGYIFFNGVYVTAINWGDMTRVEPFNLSTLEKTILFERFLLLFLVIRFLIEKEYLNLKVLFISSTIFSSFVCLDIFYQFIFGKDIFGFPNYGRNFSGPFNDELIAGGYIQRFSIFSLFLLPIFFPKIKKNNSIIFTLIFFLVALFGITVAGNRMPFFLFFIMIFLIFLFEEKLRKYLIYFTLLFGVIFLLLYNFNSTIKNNFNNFYGKAKTLLIVTVDKEYREELTILDSPKLDYYKEFDSFYETWLINKYIGGGIKSFRYYCHKGFKNKIKKLGLDPILTKEKLPEFNCNTHPHNYYLEILTDLGAIGLVLISIMFVGVIYVSLIKKYLMTSNLNQEKLITPFIFPLFIEIFPIKSSGSFFTTGNATFIFLILAITVAISRKKSLN